MNAEEYLKIENEMDAEMATIWEKPYLDGITDFENYKKATTKLLWILKEPNSIGGGNQRVFHKDVRDYSRWKSTFGNIMRVSYAILEKIDEYKKIPEIDTKECTINNKPVLNEIAIINVNKSGGGSITPSGKLDVEYRRKNVKEYLFKQIELINPQIIINTHDVYQFFKDQV